MTDSSTALSARLLAVVDALPLRPGLRVLEIGGGTGGVARAVAARVGEQGRVLLLDRSATAVAGARRHCADEIAAGRMEVRRGAVESFALEPDEAPYDLAFAIRVGALDGRHPRLAVEALPRVRAALVSGGRLLVGDAGSLRDL